MINSDKDYKAHLFVCVNKKENGESCAPKGAVDLRNSLKTLAQDPARGWHGKVRINNSGCLGPCEKGINAVLYPEGKWFSNLTVDSVSELEQAIKEALEK